MIVAETTVCPLVKAACRDFAELQGSDLASLNESAVLLLAFALGWCVFRPTLHVLCYRVKPAAGETGKKELHRNAWCSQAVALVDETLGLKKALLTLLGQRGKIRFRQPT
ncbi:unnamed protein product [Cladocopium goreaui]|uniref:Uncharacterized protein n=1 Tax=Cladocopium goreaui TaxID=2562237 RepID=A0A9P1FRX1_9DINO|nr:unnamed protein product [Cladocopium goreaui]|mmetsp:Transcript_2991/g.6847  ORF Transcript_2991/g.6847 Transcript_2991/m.6847 type:complete len:110 (+) Transcript_2991:132-461(+)